MMEIQSKNIKKNRLGDFSPVTHVIFDMDGLLLDTEKLYTVAANKVASKFTRNGSKDPKLVTWDLKVKQMGLQKKELSEIMVDELQLSCTPEVYLKETEKLHHELFPDVELMPGVVRLLDHLSLCKIPMALATSSSKEYLSLKTSKKHADIFRSKGNNFQGIKTRNQGRYFEHLVTGASDPEVIQGKPFPDINLVCAKRFQSPPEDLSGCLVFEDSPNGVKAALSAGMQCVMVPDPQIWSTPQYTMDADIVIPSLLDFRPELFHLPPFSDPY